MALSADKTYDANSNLVQGHGSQTLAFTMPGGVAMKVESVAATISNGAGVAITPELTISDQSGVVIASQRQASVIPSADTGVATWALRLGGSGGGPGAGSGIPPATALDDYVYRHSNLTVTGVGFTNGTLLLQGNAIALDGATRVKIEVWVPACETVNSPGFHQAIGLELYDGATDKGTICYVGGSLASTADCDYITPVYGVVIDTPSAGTHTYSIKAWKNVASGTCTVYGSTFIDGTGNLPPAWLRVTAT